MFMGRSDNKAEAPLILPLDVKIRVTGKDPDAGKGRRQEEKEMDEMVGWDR